MILFKKAADLCKWVDAQQEKGNSIAFVPTMGALHAGHISLLEIAKKNNPITVSSIFVNPTQFNDPKDYEKYPITVEKDIAMLEAAGCDVLFLPSVKEMYPSGQKATQHYDLGYLETVLEGTFRPGHFQGVCMVVHRLLEIVQPDNLYLGQKDYQQCMVLTKLVQLECLSTNIIICPTQRETDGLAMSSRNVRLTTEYREKAPLIYQTLQFIQTEIKPGDITAVKQQAFDKLVAAGFKPDYLEVANAQTLELLNDWDGKTPLVALVAAFAGDVRLIDNLVL